MSDLMYGIMQNQQVLLTALAEKAGLLNNDEVQKAMRSLPSIGTKHTLDFLSNQAELEYNQLSFFFDCNLERPVGNLTIQPMASFLAMLPVRPTTSLDVKYSFLTDWDTEQTGPLPVEPCDDPQAIDISHNFCKMRFPLGRHDKKTQTMELDRLIAVACQNAFDDFYFLGDVRGVSIIPRRAFNPSSRADRDLINRGAVMKQIQAVMREHQKWLVDVLWSGDPTNNTAGGGYKEPIGLLHLINDDYPNDPLLSQYLESESGNLADCEAMNSDCKVFNNCIGDPTNNPNLWAIMQELEEVIWQRAFQSGQFPARWIWVMNPVIWEQLTKFLPCQIDADGCTNIGGDVDDAVRINFDVNNIAMRNEMRSSRTLTINGRRYSVVIDYSLPYNATGTEIQSTIYFIPLVLAGEEVLWIEHLDYRRISQALSPLPGTVGNMLGWTDGGRYHWTINFLRRCFEVMSKIEPRVVFKGSRFAGCVEQVRACTIQDRTSLNYWPAEGAVVPPP